MYTGPRTSPLKLCFVAIFDRVNLKPETSLHARESRHNLRMGDLNVDSVEKRSHVVYASCGRSESASLRFDSCVSLRVGVAILESTVVILESKSVSELPDPSEAGASASISVFELTKGSHYQIINGANCLNLPDAILNTHLNRVQAPQMSSTRCLKRAAGAGSSVASDIIWIWSFSSCLFPKDRETGRS